MNPRRLLTPRTLRGKLVALTFAALLLTSLVVFVLFYVLQQLL